jgi:hypothetical protein
LTLEISCLALKLAKTCLQNPIKWEKM